jgi:hypothetical protein
MTENEFPKKLLIYSHIDKYCVDVILKNRFVVTDPTKGFNDPLDCYFEFVFTGWEKERLIEHLTGIFIIKKGKALNDLTQKDHNEIHREKERLTNLSESNIEKELSDYSTQTVRESLSNLLRIRCFSALNMKKILNNVLFSHYGDSHKGLCYIFDTEKLIPTQHRQSLIEVRYCCKPASIKYKEGIHSQEDKLNKIGQNMVKIKHQDWEYEKEWRLQVKAEVPDNIHETMGFTPNALEGIVLGLKATKEDEERIIKLAEKRHTKLKIFRAKQMSGSFELQYENNTILE